MTSLGDTLRRARLQRNLELNRIADELKISASMLKAIEEERFDKLPGGVFARSFVRQYARLLEVDEQEIEGALTRVLEPPEKMAVSHAAHIPESEIPLPRMSGWQAIGDNGSRWSSSAWSLVLMIVVMLACAGAYAWWQRERRPVVAHEKTPVTAPPAPQVAAAPSAPAPPPAADPAATPTPSLPAPVATQAAPPPESAHEGPAVAEAAASNPSPDVPVRVEVQAQESTWISVRTDGQDSFSGVLDANQIRSVAGNRNVLLKVGNAGGVEVRFKGKPIGPLGAKGSVRTIQFTSGGFQILPPEAPKPEPPTVSPDPL
jgi:cytoskeleton protein RodZ